MLIPGARIANAPQAAREHFVALVLVGSFAIGCGATAAPTTDAASPLGSYTGYFENFMFASGSDGVAMNLALGADGVSVTGTVLLGRGPPPPAATNPDIGWPANGSLDVVEGFAYTVLQGAYESPRLTLQIAEDEPWGPWCELQTVTYPVPNGYACVPDDGFSQASTGCTLNPKSGPRVPIDCGKLALCENRVCSCIATGCSLPPLTAGDIHFDIQLTTGDGSTTGLPNASSRVNMHMSQP
jgi:hypothetical protein